MAENDLPPAENLLNARLSHALRTYDPPPYPPITLGEARRRAISILWRLMHEDPLDYRRIDLGSPSDQGGFYKGSLIIDASAELDPRDEIVAKVLLDLSPSQLKLEPNLSVVHSEPYYTITRLGPTNSWENMT